MNTTTIAATLAMALLAVTSAGCASQATKEEAALQRAYKERVSVTGTRIKQRLERSDETSYPLESLNREQAQESVRLMREATRVP